MSAPFIFAMIILVIGVIVTICLLVMEGIALCAISSVITTILTVVFLVVGAATVVGTREIGIVTTFGRPVAELPNGFHWKAPWSRVTEMDGAIQIDTHTGQNAPLVRLANNSMANVDNSVQWRLRPDAVKQLFLDYRSFDNIRENLVTRQLTNALNEVFETMDPLGGSIAVGQTAPSDGIDTVAMGNRVRDALRAKVGRDIDIISVLTPVIHYDASTQKRVDDLNVERANTRIAEQKQKTALAEADANRTLSESVSHDPNVLVSKCLDAVREAKISPLGCWPGAAAVPTVPAR